MYLVIYHFETGVPKIEVMSEPELLILLDTNVNFEFLRIPPNEPVMMPLYGIFIFSDHVVIPEQIRAPTVWKL